MSTSPSTASQDDFTTFEPPQETARRPAREEAIETEARLRHRIRRLQRAQIIRDALIGCAIVSFSVALPLRQVTPMLLDQDKVSGEIRRSASTVLAYKVSDQNVRYHLREWASQLLTMNAYRTKSELLPQAYTKLRGSKAKRQYDDFLAKEKPVERLIENPVLARDVDHVSYSPVAGSDNVVLMRLRLTTRDGGEPKVERKVLTVQFLIDLPNDEKTADTNPSGVYISDFSIASET